ncbi:MAG: hypothetical protein IJ744_10280 [Lachnospiraceae bacterium]|nr:hypothetical protein [Lachnospiraceae bacterium]
MADIHECMTERLEHAEIPFHYEFPMRVAGTWYHPDFLILDLARRREVLWEHLGMMDDRIYAQNALDKLDAYASAGFYLGENLVITWETSRRPLTYPKIRRTIAHYFLDD